MNTKIFNYSGGLTPKAPTVSVTDVERPYQFEQISADEKLWAAVYNGEDKNAVQALLEKWKDPQWVAEYFANANPQQTHYDLSAEGRKRMIKITGSCVNNLIDNLQHIQTVTDGNIDYLGIVEPYHTFQTRGETLIMTKLKPLDNFGRKQCLRLYGVETADGCTVITGGGIKLEDDLRDDPLLKAEGEKAAKMYDYLRSESVFDLDSFRDFTSTENLVYPH